jgi:hypothetical protein
MPETVAFPCHESLLYENSLNRADIFVPAFLIVLDNYRIVLQQGGSIALG